MEAGARLVEHLSAVRVFAKVCEQLRAEQHVFVEVRPLMIMMVMVMMSMLTMWSLVENRSRYRSSQFRWRNATTNSR